MNDLIEALQILQKYVDSDVYAPTHCEHDVFAVYCVNPDDVSEEDKTRLDELGFHVSEDEYGESRFMSYRYGSC